MKVAQSLRERRYEAPDVVSSTVEYSRRFSGSAGRYFLEIQTRHLSKFVQQCGAQTLLDVGGGHGQVAIPFVRQGHEVTVVGSDASCELLLQRSLRPSQYDFIQSDLLNLPFPDNSFDVVVALRLMAHLTRWPLLLRELCRVSRRGVIVDYPETHSLNRCHRQLFGLKQAIERNARPFHTLTSEELLQSFAANGFDISNCAKQFFLPMAIHRAVGSEWFSSISEWTFQKMGFTLRWGSPAIVLAQPFDNFHRGRG